MDTNYPKGRIALILFALVYMVLTVILRERHCSNFTTQAQAQAAMERHPKRLAGLDGDKDGKACENLFSKSKTIAIN